MTLLLYAVADRGHPVPAGMTGLGGSRLRPVAAGELVAIVGDCPSMPQVTPHALVEFEQTVEALMDDQTLLPARFGTTLADESAAHDLLTKRHHQLADALRRVAGAVEMGVRAGWRETVEDRRPSGERAGADYLLGRLERRQRARRIATGLDAALGGLARERACRIQARPQGQVTAAYLVTRPRVDEFRLACQRFAESVNEASLVCTGPWPPYSFVDSVPT